MKYFKYLKIIALTLIIGIIGCSLPDSKSTNNFALLPSVAEGNFTNKISTLDVSMLKIILDELDFKAIMGKFGIEI